MLILPYAKKITLTLDIVNSFTSHVRVTFVNVRILSVFFSSLTLRVKKMIDVVVVKLVAKVHIFPIAPLLVD